MATRHGTVGSSRTGGFWPLTSPGCSAAWAGGQRTGTISPWPGRSAQIQIQEVRDALDGPIRGRVCGNHLRIEGELALADEDGGHPVLPGLLHRREDAQLVVHQDVAL